MNVLTAIYNLLLGPLKLFFEVVFVVANRVIGNEGLAIVFLSLAMNFLVLPLYRRADAMQAEERDLEMKLQPWVSHIKKTFKGDEQYMMLQTFYRQNNYKPAYALKGSLSLLLEIPFFIAAYQFLSHLDILWGVSFGPIANLGAPDGLIVIGSLSINLLPILMTAINIVSGAIYTKGYPLKSKLQLYGMALIFLVFLYGSPSGLVFYWTLNNLFSLVKNIFYKLKNPKLVLSILASIAGLGLLAATFFVSKLTDPVGIAFTAVLFIALQLPITLYIVGRKGHTLKLSILDGTPDKTMFFLGAAFLTLLTGLLIPSAVIGDSPLEFIDLDLYLHPAWYLVNSCLMAAGTFVLWFGVFYFLAGDKGKKALELAVWVLCGVFTVNYMFFGTDLGTLSSELQYDVTMDFPMKTQLLNLAVLAVLAVVFLLAARKRPLVKTVYLAGLVALGAMSVMNVVRIQSSLSNVTPQALEQNDDTPYMTLSKDGENVVVIMLDRAIGKFVPYLVQERPELAEIFDGFTFYPNAVSHGKFTNFGTPGLFGGYEYTPDEMNKRDGELLKDKHNEALLVMPTLFSENGFTVTVCDPPYAGDYEWTPDLSIYDHLENTNAFITEGYFSNTSESKQAGRYRNFFCYSIVKSCPLIVQPSLYYRGTYNSPGNAAYIETPSISYGISSNFLECYSALEHMSDMTRIDQDVEKGFVIFVNSTTHEPFLLQEPEYLPSEHVDNTVYDAEHADRFTVDGETIMVDGELAMTHYETNMVSLMRVGDWLDFLREQGVYDNTRIIIVADHGRNFRFSADWMLEDIVTSVISVNPLFLVKDFNSHGALRTDETFMTNADVPTLAMEGVIDDPVNPATGNPINSDAKDHDQLILISDDWDTDENNGTKFFPGKWFTVHDDIFDTDNWEYLGEY